MKYYSGYNQPYIYALFPDDLEAKIEEILNPLVAKDILFWHHSIINKKELKKVAASYALIAFITEDFVNTKEFHEVINMAVKEDKAILTIFLQDVELDAWGHMQLDSAQYLALKNKDFQEKLLEASIFKNMQVTKQQKTFQKQSSLLAIGTPIIAATLIFSLIIYPLMLAPDVKVEDTFGIDGLSQAELDSIKSIYIVGDTIYKGVSKVHCWYSNNRQQMNLVINESNGQKIYTYDIEKGTIGDLSDLTKLRNLECLYLVGQEISDLTPIFSLTNLKELSVDCNPISSIDGINQLINLESLSISGTDVEDLSPLNGLKNFKSIVFDGTPVSVYPDTEILSNLDSMCVGGTGKLPYLGVHSGNQAFDLDLRDISVSDYSFIKDIQNFDSLNGGNDCSLSTLLPYIEGKQFSQFCFAGFNDLYSLADLNNINVTSRLDVCWSRSLTSLAGIEDYDGKTWQICIKHCPNIQDYYLLNNLKYVKEIVISSDMKEAVLSQLKDDVCFTLVYEDD